MMRECVLIPDRWFCASGSTAMTEDLGLRDADHYGGQMEMLEGVVVVSVVHVRS